MRRLAALLTALAAVLTLAVPAFAAEGSPAAGGAWTDSEILGSAGGITIKLNYNYDVETMSGYMGLEGLRSDGTTAWEHWLGYYEYHWSEAVRLFAIKDGRAYIRYDGLRVLSLRTGKLIWSNEDLNEVYSEEGGDLIITDKGDLLFCDRLGMGFLAVTGNGVTMLMETGYSENEDTLLAYHYVASWSYSGRNLLVQIRARPYAGMEPSVFIKNLTIPVPDAVGFADVRTSDWFAGSVKWALDSGLTSGTSDSTFSPDRTCTEAEVLTFLWRAEGSPEPSGPSPFTDVKPGDYFHEAALWAHEKGLVTGNRFDGSAPCTRASTVTYMWKLSGSPDLGTSSFGDVPGDAPCSRAVAWAVRTALTSGTSASTFSPDMLCTRAQIVTFLHRFVTA